MTENENEFHKWYSISSSEYIQSQNQFSPSPYNLTNSQVLNQVQQASESDDYLNNSIEKISLTL